MLILFILLLLTPQPPRNSPLHVPRHIYRPLPTAPPSIFLLLTSHSCKQPATSSTEHLTFPWPEASRTRSPSTMTIKYCGGHKGGGGGGGCECHRDRLHRKLCGALLAFILLALFIILIVYLVLRPHRPRFYLQDLAVLCLNVTPPASAYLFTTMQATVAARNPNDRVGVYYDSADVYAQYKGVPITVPTRLPVSYQGHRDQSVWSPYLRSMDSVVLSPELAVSLAQDETAGYVLIDIRVDGQVRWKVGTWISGQYHLKANCPALITVNQGRGSYGATTGGGTEYFRFQQAAACNVDV
uniref:Uncharacterized protein n=1 Tax=Avena sativa TaxID=4498 RepID=A0ACD5Z1S9_AVESA